MGNTAARAEPLVQLEHACSKPSKQQLQLVKENILPNLGKVDQPSVYVGQRLPSSSFPDERPEWTSPAFLTAVEQGNVAAVEHLCAARGLQIPPDILAPPYPFLERRDATVLRAVPQQDADRMIPYLVRKGARLDAVLSKRSVLRRDAGHPTVLCWASSTAGQLPLLEALLEAKADPNAPCYPSEKEEDDTVMPSRENYRPLEAAAGTHTGKEGVEVVRLLLQHGANPDGHAGSFGAPLAFAVTRYQVDMALLLLEYGASLEFGKGRLDWQMPVLFLLKSGNATLLERLVAAGMQVPENWRRMLGTYVSAEAAERVNSTCVRGKEKFTKYIEGLRNAIIPTTGLMRPVANLVATYMTLYFPPPEELPMSRADIICVRGPRRTR